jgi:hypothetical protein
MDFKGVAGVNSMKTVKFNPEIKAHGSPIRVDHSPDQRCLSQHKF